MHLVLSQTLHWPSGLPFMVMPVHLLGSTTHRSTNMLSSMLLRPTLQGSCAPAYGIPAAFSLSKDKHAHPPVCKQHSTYRTATNSCVAKIFPFSVLTVTTKAMLKKVCHERVSIHALWTAKLNFAERSLSPIRENFVPQNSIGAVRYTCPFFPYSKHTCGWDCCCCCWLKILARAFSYSSSLSSNDFTSEEAVEIRDVSYSCVCVCVCACASVCVCTRAHVQTSGTATLASFPGLPRL